VIIVYKLSITQWSSRNFGRPGRLSNLPPFHLKRVRFW